MTFRCSLIFLCFLPGFIFAAEPLTLAPDNPRLTFSLPAQGTRIVRIPLQKGEYIAGGFKASSAIRQVEVKNPQEQRVKRLLPFAARSQRLFYVAEEAGEHRLWFTAAANEAEVALYIDHFIQSQPVSPSVSQKPPRSPMLQQALKQWQQSQSSRDFWRRVEAQGTPLVEPGDSPDTRLITFLWRGARRGVRLLGGPSGEHPDLQRLGETDIWFYSHTVPADTLLSYKLAPEVPVFKAPARVQRTAILATAQQDPFNKTPWLYSRAQDKYTTWSILNLRRDLAVNNLNTRAPALHTYQFTSAILNNRRDITLYRSARLAADATSAPLLIFFDGDKFTRQINAPATLERLIDAGVMPPAVAVFIDPVSNDQRAEELTCNKNFGRFLAQELKPWVAQQTGLNFPAGQTLLSGASYGGLASLCFAFFHPEDFGMVLSQSGSFWWGPASFSGDNPQEQWLINQLEQDERKPIKVYLNAGVFEDKWILPANIRLARVLKEKGYPYRFRKLSSGHDWLAWHFGLEDGLRYLFEQPE